MWKQFATSVRNFLPNQLAAVFNVDGSLKVNQQCRTTFILKRRNPVPLSKIGQRPKRLKNRHFIYDLVQDTSVAKQETVDLILTDYVSGLGDVGDRVAVKSFAAYNKLLLPGLAVYATPENEEKYARLKGSAAAKPKFSSPHAQRTVNYLSTMVLSVVMNKEVPWTVEPWHVRMSFRKANVHVPESAIEMPQEAITGPDLGLERKQFLVTVTINGVERVAVKCRIHHWSTKVVDRLPYLQDHWLLPAEPLFPEAAAGGDPKPTAPGLQ
ncbi:large ribosomal subunit protein bL9m [Bacillus rossius redtenbacheri]|uniref:large ribosomal subunit protein bL9m n=1 Tax=Bacillus rossius redtenbacheri TaxID=93214 RepID=UPI002FDE4813